MGNDESARAIRKITDDWNVMLDQLSDYHAGKVEADEVVSALTRYVTSLGTKRIEVRNG